VVEIRDAEGTLRLFVAVSLPEDVKEHLAQTQSRLKPTAQPVRWVNPSSVHLTLSFLGAVPATKVEAIGGALERAVHGLKPFRFEVADLGMFPSASRPRVVWVGIKGSVEALARLQQRVAAELEPLGFPPEKRPFSPHLTLGRVEERAGPADRQKIGQAVQSTRVGSLGGVDVDSICLMRSTLRPGGAIYDCLRKVEFAGGGH
jgi:RNA 2',3'-cyclic 3'-phosphodiesterase